MGDDRPRHSTMEGGGTQRLPPRHHHSPTFEVIPCKQTAILSSVVENTDSLQLRGQLQLSLVLNMK